ncbi:histidine kinase [Herbiconiux sp. 11R-BC]|uniref:sensor histidine kinase n=1 Tax=Herbiconiux sp. 11R-BC TaxID=3111637 RepID=UPI003C077B13
MTASSDPGAAARRRRRVLGVVGTVVSVVLVAGSAFAPGELGGAGWSSIPSALVLLALFAAVLLRNRFPLAAAISAIAIGAIGFAVDAPPGGIAFGVLVVLFTAATLTDRRTTIVVALVAAAVLGTAAGVFLPETWRDARTVVQIVVFVGFVSAAGDATRSRRAFIESITERALRAEQTKEAEAQRRVAEERLRIARDLHDVMAHQIAVISLHANAATASLRTRPDDAERSLGTIREAARTVLGEIGSLLTVLRAADGPDAGAGTLAGPGRGAGAGAVGAGAPVVPVPGLDDLDALLADFERSGFRVDVRTAGERMPLPAPVDIVAFRVIQEALTNAHKHGSDGSALLSLDYSPEAVEIIVTNVVETVAVPAGGAAAAGASAGPSMRAAPLGSGHGLLGAAERVASVNGTLETAAGPGPVFRFTARLPLDGAAAAPGTPAARPASAAPPTASTAGAPADPTAPVPPPAAVPAPRAERPCR